MKIESKHKFFELWMDGVLGNRTRLWKDPHKALEDARKFGIKEIGFREVRRAGTVGAGKWEKVPREEILCAAARWVSEGRRFLLDDGCPNDKMTLQGEVCRTYQGLQGFLDIGSKLPMRPAMAAGKLTPRSPLETMILIRQFMDPSSQDDLWVLLDRYPDAAIEFCCFSVNVGIFPNRNTILWEVRNY